LGEHVGTVGVEVRQGALSEQLVRLDAERERPAAA
jgi:hypothetical protein